MVKTGKGKRSRTFEKSEKLISIPHNPSYAKKPPCSLSLHGGFVT